MMLRHNASMMHLGGLSMKHFVDRLFDVALYLMLIAFVANLIRGAI
jgi:hypothetical protein